MQPKESHLSIILIKENDSLRTIQSMDMKGSILPIKLKSNNDSMRRINYHTQKNQNF